MKEYFMEFKNVEHVKTELEKAEYICSKTIATVVFLAQATHKPVLVEGPAGVGKTELSKAVARSLERRLIRLQCYEGLDANSSLYEWNYQRQLLQIKLEEHEKKTLKEKEQSIFSKEDLRRSRKIRMCMGCM